jgi:hypothetical protein
MKGNSMKKNVSLSFFIVLVCFLAVFVFVSAEPGSLKVVDAEKYEITIGNYDAKILVPEIKGLADTKQQDQLNGSFSDHAGELVQNFISEAKSIRQQFPEDGPHFELQYQYEVLYDNEDNMVFRVFEFTAAGSSNYMAQYFTVDKRAHKLLSLSDITGGKADAMEKIRAYIEESMREYNKNNDMKYWVDDGPEGGDYKESLDKVFASIEEKRQYYLNEERQLVITFNKYDVAPGAMGSPEFIIPNEILGKN